MLQSSPIRCDIIETCHIYLSKYSLIFLILILAIFLNFYKQRSVKVLAGDYMVDLKAQVQNSQILIIIPFCALRWAKRIGFCPY